MSAQRFSSDAMLEACCPLGDKWHPREAKLAAMRLVVFERLSEWEASKRAGVPYRAVCRWVAEFEQRYLHALKADGLLPDDTAAA